ncbi:MAG: ATP-binding cassette domain-containing protein [Alphaproteobacteria bacterium]|nr:ATP-binding cassette domain-containing protein [Alphaproteobacteria bacterium]
MDTETPRKIPPPPRKPLPPPPGGVVQPAVPAADPTPAPEPKSPIHIHLRDLHKSFGPKHVLNGLNLEVPRGESVVIIGGSGTGKSVMLKCILGILVPDQGSILVDDKETVGQSARAREAMLRHFGMLFQGAALFDSLSVWQNVAFGLIQGRKMRRDEAKDIAFTKLAQVGLGPEVGELSPAELSGGMQKRVGLARAIAADPDVIFFDEPTTGLDPIMADVINDLIVKCVKEIGATAVSITHDMASARKIADKIAMIYKGEIIWEGPADEVDNSGNDHVQQFINGSAEGPIQMEVLKP